MTDGEKVGRRSEEDGVEILVLKNPPVNALSLGVIADLGRRLTELEDDRNVRAVVLTGDGQYFSAGADVKEMATLDLSQAPEIARRGLEVYGRLAALRAPVIAAINGLAVGGGLELALACDLRIAGESAKFGAPEVGLGLIPAYGGTQRLPRLIGVAKAKELIFTGAMISAAEAARIGLVNRTVPAGQELRAARDLAHTIAQKAPRAVQAAKRSIREGLDRTLEDGLKNETTLFETEVLPTEDLGEGILAFAERRPPKFKGV
ncbi:MAG TPA: enoyl-CoA hydratase-related protein [Thermoplasmata archaeon]|jgi:enoyl-CoA hydratase|nr:enoyl-CoA hydratase-related protein [Thermoplasmata archaeon]